MQSTQNDKRFYVVFTLSLIGATLAAFANIIMIWLQSRSNPNDDAYGWPLWKVLLDPFVIMVAAPVAAFSGVIAFLIVYYWLSDTTLWKTMALLYAIVIGEIVSVGAHDTLMAWFLSYPTLVAAAGLSKLLFRRRHLTNESAKA